ncbi:50S ribosomal protein L10 [Natronoflexus pectinivorans]|uniref:Large ribosomal subunit protein uL10 n=1 Tax=Natronoflexus pectinivorans TaxID=682526 RepID=A0A4R2GLD8_9BACT|nr:50S ribosomal protein L10 [Natronoflexus pectinivorans]TCO09794.1 large subunit ribosomal protein L10 [Natronoflexus pectinivorans]
MKKTEKATIINELVNIIGEYSHFYIADTQGLNAGSTSDLRRLCFNKEVKMMVVKNSLFQKAIEQSEKNIEGLDEALKGTSAVLFSNTGNLPAKLIKEFRKKATIPIFKGAFVEESVYIGESQLDTLSNIKSKEELLGDVIGLLQSPMKNVVSALQSGGSTISGILKTLEERK